MGALPRLGKRMRSRSSQSDQSSSDPSYLYLDASLAQAFGAADLGHDRAGGFRPSRVVTAATARAGDSEQLPGASGRARTGRIAAAWERLWSPGREMDTAEMGLRGSGSEPEQFQRVAASDRGHSSSVEEIHSLLAGERRAPVVVVGHPPVRLQASRRRLAK